MNKKNVLILCTGNSCRSIMAEALINEKLGDTIFAQSSGVKASGKVNPHAMELLKSKGYCISAFGFSFLNEFTSNSSLSTNICQKF